MNKSSPDVSYRHKLPHFHMESFPLFITFNLTDSLPKHVVQELVLQREKELKAYPNDVEERYKIHKRYFGKFDEWLDKGQGHKWLLNENIAQIVKNKIIEMSNVYYELISYCIMPNHVHILIQHFITEKIETQDKSKQYPVANTLRLLKGNTARFCNLTLKRVGQFWHHESYDHYVRDEKELERIILYILNNPVKAGLVNEWNMWKFTYINPNYGEW